MNALKNERLVSTVSYLFEDIEKDVGPLIASDCVIARLNERIGELKFRISEREKTETSLIAQIQEADLEIADLNARLNLARNKRGALMGGVGTMRKQILLEQRQITAAGQDIEKREEQLIRREAQARLNVLGRDLKTTRGMRGKKMGRASGYVEVPLQDKNYRTTGNNETNKTQEWDLLREIEGAKADQPALQDTEGSPDGCGGSAA